MKKVLSSAIFLLKIFFIILSVESNTSIQYEDRQNLRTSDWTQQQQQSVNTITGQKVVRKGISTSIMAPTFRVEPPSSVLLSNKYGTVIPCVIDNYHYTGTNFKITWIALIGDSYIDADDVPGLRQTRDDGSLCFPPFVESQYNNNIHNIGYICVGHTPYGRIGSREVRVRAVIDKQTDVRSLDSTTTEGNDVILRCSFSEDLFEVSLWITDDGLIVLPLTRTNTALGKSVFNKHYILSTGELLITNIDIKDVRRRYRCQVANKLTGERIDSTNWARIILTDKPYGLTPGLKSNLSPKNSLVLVDEGQPVAIYCSIDGDPRPTLDWYQSTTGSDTSLSRLTRLMSSDNYKVTANMLLIASASLKDSSKFICVANNTRAEQRYETQVFVRTSLTVTLSASTSTPSLGEDVRLNCSLTAIDSTFGSVNTGLIAGIKWFRNMRAIQMDRRIQKVNEYSIKIRSFSFTDAGIIQCFMLLKAGPNHNEWLQSAIVISMEEKGPSFTTVFSEQIKMMNSDLALKCAAVGLPPPLISWKVDEIDISTIHRARVHSSAKSDRIGTVSQLNISALRMEETGVYECIASNSLGSVSHKARINIMGSLYIKPIGNITAIVGHLLTINCSFAGYPIDEVFFLKGRGNSRLPLDERYSSPALGKITINQVEKSDEDIYKCVVLSLNGERLEQIFHLRVSAAPVISPFMFSDNLEEGMRSSAVCSVISGEPPIAIRWLKDGKPLTQIEAEVQVISINEFISSLIISNISRYHKGNYTCVASSDVAATNFTAQMSVKAAPIWIVKPSDKHVITGLPVIFDCQTSGYPQPVIRWKFVRQINPLVSEMSEPVSILSSPQIHVLENGSLSIRAVELNNQGQYICDASNGVGRPLETSAKLFVHSVPQLTVEQKQIIIRKSSQTQIQCTGFGSTPLTVQWLKNGVPLNSIDRYIVREEFKSTEKLSNIVINNAVRNDTAIFTCLAINLFGSQSQDIDFVVQEPPDPPTNLHALEVGARSITLTWNLGYTGNSVIVKHNIQYKKKSEQWFDAYMTSSTSNSVTITNLLPQTDYEFRVRIDNEIGNSDYTNSIAITTSMEAPSVVPQDVLCVPLDSKSIKISWSIAGPKSQIIDGFYIGFKPFHSEDKFTYKTMQTTGAGTPVINRNNGTANDQMTTKYEYNFDSLSRHTKYIFIVQAFNSVGNGPSSVETSAETFSNDPPEAPIVKVDSLTTTEATIMWEMALNDETNQVDGYIISYRNDGTGQQTGAQWETIQLTRQHKNYVLRNLRCGSTYIVKIEAFNEVGTGKPSDELKFTTNGKAPVAADRSLLFTVNISFVLLNLNRWSDGGCPITHFTIQYKPRLQNEWILHSKNIPVEQTIVLLPDLSPGTWYDLLMSAHNEAGLTETEYQFATLTTTGGTVEPLSIYDRSKPSPFEDPMILIPAFCAIVVLIVVSCATGFILIWKSREDANNAESYCRHRDNSRTDDLSLNSFNKVPKGDSLYDQQRVQIYYPNGYATARNGSSQQEQQSQHSTTEVVANQECGASIDPSRIRRTFDGYMEHVYDVPHRMSAKHLAQSMNETKISSYSMLWTQPNSKELLDCAQQEPNSLIESTEPALTTDSISSRDNESLYSHSLVGTQSSCFHENHKIYELSDAECDLHSNQCWITKNTGNSSVNLMHVYKTLTLN